MRIKRIGNTTLCSEAPMRVTSPGKPMKATYISRTMPAFSEPTRSEIRAHVTYTNTSTNENQMIPHTTSTRHCRSHSRFRLPMLTVYRGELYTPTAHRPTSGKFSSTRTGFKRTHSTASFVISSTSLVFMLQAFRAATAASARDRESGGSETPDATTRRY